MFIAFFNERVSRTNSTSESEAESATEARETKRKEKRAGEKQKRGKLAADEEEGSSFIRASSPVKEEIAEK